MSDDVYQLLDTFPHNTNIHLVFDFMETDLDTVIKDKSVDLTNGHVKSYMHMLLTGMTYCHSNCIMHRVRII